MRTLTLIFAVLFCITSVAQIHGPPTRYKTVSLKTVSDFFSQRPSPDAKKARLLAELLVSVFKQDSVSVAEATPLDKMGNFLEIKATENSLLYAKGADGTLTLAPLDEKKNYLARVEARLTEQRRLIKEQEQFRKAKPQSP